MPKSDNCEEILKAAVEAMEALYDLRHGDFYVTAKTDLPTTLHFHFSRPDGERIHGHVPLGYGELSEYAIQSAVTVVSRQIARQSLQP